MTPVRGPTQLGREALTESTYREMDDAAGERFLPTIGVMFSLHIEHPISDFAVWRQAFDRFADARRQAGVERCRVQRPVDDDHYISIDLDFGNSEQAEQFRRFLQERVWSSADSAPGLAGTPQTRISELCIDD
jgi:hypothetical protein